MVSISHRELRNNSAEVLRRVAGGETIQVTNNGTPAAVIGPVAGSVLDDLIAHGQARPARANEAGLERIRMRLAQQDLAAKSTSEMIDDARGRW